MEISSTAATATAAQTQQTRPAPEGNKDDSNTISREADTAVEDAAQFIPNSEASGSAAPAQNASSQSASASAPSASSSSEVDVEA